MKLWAIIRWFVKASWYVAIALLVFDILYLPVLAVLKFIFLTLRGVS